MSRERDSEIVYDLVTSKYKIAERNRQAKYRFLSNENVTNLQIKHRGSEPSLAQTEKADVKPVDLSVPGTPISSRYLDSLGAFRRNHNNIETDTEDEDAVDGQEGKFSFLLQEGLKKFTSDMEKLQQESKSHDKLESNDSDKQKKEPALSRIEKYFTESARRGSLSRDFTEVVQVFDPRITRDFTNGSKPGTPVSSKIIKAEKITSKKLQPFTENMKKLEAINTEVPPEKPKRTNPVPLAAANGKPDLVVIPPTPVPLDPKDFPPVGTKVQDNQVLVIVEKQLVVDEKPGDEENEKEDPTTFVTENKSKDIPEKVIEIHEEIKPEVTKSSSEVPISSPEVPKTSIVEPEKPSEEQVPSVIKISPQNLEKIPSKTELAEVDPKSSTSDTSKPTRKLSVPGTPVDSRKLYKETTSSTDSDLASDIEIIDSSEVTELARDLIDQIETMVNDANNENPDNQEQNKVQSYFDQSEKDSTFQRTFSEIENFNEPGMDVKEKIEKYFKESEEKKSLTRGFSEAINYIEPINIEELFKPGMPVSSKAIENLKIVTEVEEEEKEMDPQLLQGIEAFKKAHEALHQKPEFKVDKYFEESEARHTLKREFSEVIGVIGEDSQPKHENPEIKKFFEESDAQKSFRRQFSEVVQTLPPRIKDLLPDQKPPPKVHRSSIGSVFSAPDTSINPDSPSIARKRGKKYGIDKYFAASLYRTAYQRSKNQRRGSEPDHRFAIVEDEYVFGENDVLRAQVFQDDDQTPIHVHSRHKHRSEGNDEENDDEHDQQNAQFWRDFLKPYNLNLPSDIVVRDELMEKYAKYTLE